MTSCLNRSCAWKNYWLRQHWWRTMNNHTYCWGENKKHSLYTTKLYIMTSVIPSQDWQWSPKYTISLCKCFKYLFLCYQRCTIEGFDLLPLEVNWSLSTDINRQWMDQDIFVYRTSLTCTFHLQQILPKKYFSTSERFPKQFHLFLLGTGRMDTTWVATKKPKK